MGERAGRPKKCEKGDEYGGMHHVFSEFLLECEKSKKNEENTESAGDECGFVN